MANVKVGAAATLPDIIGRCQKAGSEPGIWSGNKEFVDSGRDLFLKSIIRLKTVSRLHPQQCPTAGSQLLETYHLSQRLPPPPRAHNTLYGCLVVTGGEAAVTRHNLKGQTGDSGGTNTIQIQERQGICQMPWIQILSCCPQPYLSESESTREKEKNEPTSKCSKGHQLRFFMFQKVNQLHLLPSS